MNEWKTYKLGEIARFQTGKLNSNAAIEDGKYPFFTCSPTTLHIDNYAFDQEAILLAGNNAEGNFSIKYYNGKFNAYQRTYVIEAITEYCETRYLFYSLKLYLQHFKYISQGTSTKFLTASILRNIPISLPPLETQKRIADILSAIDDKIELNRRINANLEQQAQALYKSWFVDADTTGWGTKKLADFFNVITGKKDANYSTKDGVYPFFTCSQDILKAPNYSFEGAAILLAGNGDFNVKRYIGKFEAYQRTYVLIPFEKRYHSFLYLLIKYHLQEITGGSRGSVIKFITKGNIADFTFTMPPYSIDEKLSLFDSLFNEIDKNITEINNLSTIRDTLLPKLMSGEIKV